MLDPHKIGDVIAALTSPTCCTGNIEGASDMDFELLADLFRVIHALSGYPIPDQFPEVHLVPHHELEARICPAGCGVKAFYLSGRGVFMDEALDVRNDVVARAVLLHELVHHVQNIAGRFDSLAECQAWYAREVEAYQIQNDYLRQQGSATWVYMPGRIQHCV
jgi:hypothetical protein